MNYRSDKYNNNLSILGFGCMRLTRKGTSIDYDKAEKEIMYALEHGINYFDTAYIYPGSEVLLGKILENNNCRNRINIATKLPHYLTKSLDNVDRIWQEELSRLRTDHIDYYLMHMLTDYASWQKMLDIGIEQWIKDKKASGAIRNIGFSFHGTYNEFKKILLSYDWDFCQIQYNYLDEHSQAGRAGLNLARKLGIPVIIMEPLRGGKLVDLMPQDAAMLIDNNPHRWLRAEWGLRWLWNQDGITTVLSGMNSLDMIKENISIASDSHVGMLTDEDLELIGSVRNSINKNMKVGCTGCGYCMPCPHGVNIPGIFRCYNEIYIGSPKAARKEYLQVCAFVQKSAAASACKKCGACEKKCPQRIPIRAELHKAQPLLENIPFKIIRFFIKLLRLW